MRLITIATFVLTYCAICHGLPWNSEDLEIQNEMNKGNEIESTQNMRLLSQMEDKDIAKTEGLWSTLLKRRNIQDIMDKLNNRLDKQRIEEIQRQMDMLSKALHRKVSEKYEGRI